MIILSTPHCLRNQLNNNIYRRSRSPLHSAHLDGTTPTITNAKNIIIMAAAVDNFHPLFVDKNNDDESVTNASHARAASSPRTKGIFTDSVTLPTIQITRPNLSESFSWSDFPLLTESLGYVDPAWQPNKAAGIRLKEQEKSNSDKRINLQENKDENDLFSFDMTNTLKIPSSTKAALRKISDSQYKSSNTTTLRKRTNSNKRIRNVRFDAVHIREHSVTLGDHDWCEGSLAISLDWPHVATSKSMLIDDYESMRERQGRVPRGHLPKLEYWQRKQLLQRVGGMTEVELQAMEHMEQDYHRYKYSGLPRTMTVPSIAACRLQHFV
jgi:hypothetical protein